MPATCDKMRQELSSKNSASCSHLTPIEMLGIGVYAIEQSKRNASSDHPVTAQGPVNRPCCEYNEMQSIIGAVTFIVKVRSSFDLTTQ